MPSDMASGDTHPANPPRQLFAPGADAVLRLALWSLLLSIIVGGIGTLAWSFGDFVGSVGIAPEQPVPFSHKHHSGELGLDCRNCHEQVEQQATAGLPPTHTCMTCHSESWTGASMLAPVRASLANNEPLHWVRVNRLPDYVYFNHSIHITKGVGCSSCHGAVNEERLTYPAQSFRRDFSLTCHRNPEKFVRPEKEVWNMQWQPPSDQATLGPALVKQNHILGPQQLTDCSICHR